MAPSNPVASTNPVSAPTPRHRRSGAPSVPSSEPRADAGIGRGRRSDLHARPLRTACPLPPLPPSPPAPPLPPYHPPPYPAPPPHPAPPPLRPPLARRESRATPETVRDGDGGCAPLHPLARPAPALGVTGAGWPRRSCSLTSGLPTSVRA